jgi:hypothetical protein
MPDEQRRTDPMTTQSRTEGDQDRPPIFTSIGQRSSRRAGLAILVLMISAVAVVAAVIIANLE